METKKKVSMTLSEEDIAYIEELVGETGLNKSSATSLALSFLRENYLTPSVVLYYSNGYTIVDGRCKNGVRQED